MILQLDQKIRMRTMNICLSVFNPRQIKYTCRLLFILYILTWKGTLGVSYTEIKHLSGIWNYILCYKLNVLR